MSLAGEQEANERTKLISPMAPVAPVAPVPPVQLPSVLTSVHSSRKCSIASTRNAFPKTGDVWAKRESDTPWIWYNDLYFIGPVVLFVSLFVGISFYMIYNGWTLGSSTFCATATLIGSIYGVPNQPDNVGAAFTILYYVYGISLLTALFGAIIGSMITRAPLISAQARRKIVQMEQPEDTDGDGEIGYYDYWFFLQVRFLNWICWEEYHLNYLVTSAALTWVALGVMYGVYIEHWTFDHSLYFAMNAVSMAALADPPCERGEPDSCDVGMYRGIVMSLYLLVGVPLFTVSLAQLAQLVINKAVRENEYKIINQPLTQEEYNYAANLYGNDEVLSLGEFTVLELLRLQRVSMEDLEQIKNLFCAIDEAETGMVDQPMLAKRNLIHPYGSLTTAESERLRARSGSNASSQMRAGRARAGSAGASRRNSPPLMKPSGVAFDPTVLGQQDGDLESGAWFRDREDSSVSRRSAHSSLVPEVPQSIKRMTIGEYNELVVPLAFTTLIENYEEECPEDEQPEEAADDLSSKGFNSDGEAEAEDDWLSEPAAPIANKNLSANNLLSFNLNSNGNLLSSLAGKVPSNRYIMSESEREEDDDKLGSMRRSSSALTGTGAGGTRRHRPPIRKSKSRSRRSSINTRDREISDAEKGYKSET